MRNPVVNTAVALGIGVVLAPWLPVDGTGWAAAAVGCLLVAVGLDRVRTHGAIVAALAVGVWCAGQVPQGPVLAGDVGFVGVRVGAASGRTADVELERPAVGRVRVRFPGDPPPAGTAVMGFGRAGPVRGALPGAPDPVRAAAAAGVRTEVAARRFARLDGDPTPILDDGRDPTGLMRAVLTGDRRGCSQHTLAVLRRTGTSHLLSISGFHVGAAAGLAALLAGRLARGVGTGLPAAVQSAAPAVVAIAAAWLYTALALWPVPAERAAAMLTAAILARTGGRGVDPLPLLAIVAVTLALLDPGSPWTPSYQLSFGAMAGMALFSHRVTRYLPPDTLRPVRYAVEGLGATVGATLGTLPFAAWWFQAVAPLGAVANLVALPTLGLALVPIAAAAAWSPDPLAATAAWAGTALASVVLRVLELLAVDPWTPAVGPVGVVGLVVAIVVAARWPVLGGALGALVLSTPRLDPRGVRVTILDVGQGSAALVEDGGRRTLIDGGRAPDDVLAWLRRSGVRRIDVVVQSHPDEDHVGGLRAVVRELEVGELWAIDLDPALGALAVTRRVPVRTPTRWWPPLGAPGPDNERSIVVPVGPVLWTGDAGRASEVVFAEDAVPVPILAVGHHGSAGSTTDRLLDRVAPGLAVISVGRDNAYGHPADAVLRRLERRGIPVLRTDRDGTVVITAADGGWVARGRATR